MDPYRRNGVREYWMVHQDGRGVVPSVLDGDAYRQRTIVSGVVASECIEGFVIALDDLYEGVEIAEERSGE